MQDVNLQQCIEQYDRGMVTRTRGEARRVNWSKTSFQSGWMRTLPVMLHHLHGGCPEVDYLSISNWCREVGDTINTDMYVEALRLTLDATQGPADEIPYTVEATITIPRLEQRFRCKDHPLYRGRLKGVERLDRNGLADLILKTYFSRSCWKRREVRAVSWSATLVDGSEAEATLDRFRANLRTALGRPCIINIQRMLITISTHEDGETRTAHWFIR